MTTKGRLLLLALVLGASAAALASPDDANDPAALERRLVEAIAKGDLTTYDRIVADDYVVFDAAGKTTTKSEVMASYRSGSRKYTDLTIYDVESHVFGDTAVVAAKTRGMRRENGRDVPNRVRYVRVFARRDGVWRAVSQMAAPMPEETAAPREPATPAKQGSTTKDGATTTKGEATSLSGSWGGNHVGMDITTEGARLDFDCAHGVIGEPIRPDAEGRFEVEGSYTLEGPGPARKDEARRYPARYWGQVRGETITLKVQPNGYDANLPTLELSRGRPPNVRKCG